MPDIEGDWEWVEVTDWYKLGMQLDFSQAKLSEIQKNYPPLQDWGFKVVDTKCWERLAQAVEAMDDYKNCSTKSEEENFRRLQHLLCS